MSLFVENPLAWFAFIVFSIFQLYFVYETNKYRGLFNDFFKKSKGYETYTTEINGEYITQLEQVGAKNSDLNVLIAEINHYVAKTKGTTDFSVIQNKVERKLNMRYEQSVAKLAFPTYFGLMGTFAGVFIGIGMFNFGFDDAGNITDESIRKLLEGVLVSMSTSFFGLLFTIINNVRSADSRKKIEEDKNEFYDFVQTELMPALDVSMVLAITKLHETVDKFEPAFDRVINRFQDTFDKCTRAFGESFEKNVTAVANAVTVMGENMDKINQNIDLQEQLIHTIKSDELVKGMDKYIEASEHFVSITKSLDKFEEARCMMLAATQEAINIQNQYSDSLQIPREVAVRVNQILDRIKTFEENVNNIGQSLAQREIMGNGVIEAIKEQVDAIRKKNKIAIKYFETADGKLEDVFKGQTKLIDELNRRYTTAIENHFDEFDKLLMNQNEEIKKQHNEFVGLLQQHLSVEEIHKDFSNLRKLNDVLEQMRQLTKNSVNSDELSKELNDIQKELEKISESKNSWSLFSRK